MHSLSPVTDNCSSWISRRERMAVEMFSWPSLHERMCRTWGSNPGPPACQANKLPIELPRPVRKEERSVKPVYQQMILSPLLGTAGKIILWHIRSSLLTLIFISVAFPPRPLIRDWNALLSPLLKVPRMLLLSSLLWWEIGTSLPGHGPD